MAGKKVLFVINSLGRAGAEVAMLELLRRLCKYELELYVYVLTGQGEMVKDLPEGVRLLNKSFCDSVVHSSQGRKSLAKKVIKSAFSRGSVFRNFGYLVSNFVRMVSKKRIQPDKLLWRVLSDGADVFDEEYDLAVSFLEGGSAYYVCDHVKAKKKAAFIHIDYSRAGYTRKLDKDCYLKFDRVFAVSGEVMENFLAAYPECKSATQVFHNMLDEERIHRLSLEEDGFEDDFGGIRILTVGRLMYQKAFDLAIEAMKLIKDAGYPARWYVVGEGDLRGSLEKQIASLDLQKDFVLLGAKANPYPFYRQADIYAHLTRFEGKSIAIQEAQILGKPIVASDCSGNHEQIENGVDGILCELEPEAMKDAIIRFIENPELSKICAANAQKRQNIYADDINMLLSLVNIASDTAVVKV